MRRLKIAAVVVGLLSGGLLIAANVPTSAHPTLASDVTPHYFDDGTGSGSVLGVSFSQLDTFPTYTAYNGGGWTTDPYFYSVSSDIGTVPAWGWPPIACHIGEPITDSSGTYRTLYLAVSCTRHDVDTGSASAVFHVNGGLPSRTSMVVTCAPTAHSNVADDYTLTGGTDTGGDDENRDGTVQNNREAITTTRTFASPCDYVVSVDAVVGYWHSVSLPIIETHYVWSAAQALGSHVYGADGSAAGVCAALDTAHRSTECASLLPVDGTDFLQVCGAPPAAAWATWDWLPSNIGYYARCLFVPVNGWDSTHLVDAGVARSPIGVLVNSVQPSVLAVTALPGGCGVLMDGIAGPLGHVVINSCAWSGWASPVQTILGYAVYISGGWFALGFIWETVGYMLGIQSAIRLTEIYERTD